jgi:hypothetical protein
MELVGVWEVPLADRRGGCINFHGGDGSRPSALKREWESADAVE